MSGGGGGIAGADSPRGPRSRAASTRPENPSSVTAAQSRPPAPPRRTCQRPNRSRQTLWVWSMTSPRERANCVAMATASGDDTTRGGGGGGGGGGTGRTATAHAQKNSRRTARRSFMFLPTPIPLGGCAGNRLSAILSPASHCPPVHPVLSMFAYLPLLPASMSFEQACRLSARDPSDPPPIPQTADRHPDEGLKNAVRSAHVERLL